MAESSEPEKPKTLEKDSVWEVYVPRGLSKDKEAVPIASFPMIIYFWPSLFVFAACGILQAAGAFTPASLGLVTVLVWSLNLLVIVTDLDQKKFVIALLVFILVAVLGWVSTLKDFGLVGSLGGWISRLEVTFSTQAYFLVASILLVLFLTGLAQPRFNYWRFEANEFVHYIQPWGRDQSIPRQGSTVTREIPDILELILTFGGGTLVVRREGQVVARIEHVPFLGRRMIALERLLSSTRVKAVA